MIIYIMHNVHFFGKFRKLALKQSATDDSMINLAYVENEVMCDLLQRLGIATDDVGEMFVNHNVAELDTVIDRDDSRIAIFPIGMHLLCGGQHLKGHGFITKHPTNKTNYFGLPK